MHVKLPPACLFGTKLTSRMPPQREMVVVVRGVYRLRPHEPVLPIESFIEQGYLSGDMFRPEDTERTGDLLHASDFADFKLKTDLLLKGTCWPGGGRVAHDCTVKFRVAEWSKSVRVFGRRVWTERSGDPISTPAPFVSMPLGWENAFGGAEYEKNPVGRGFKSPELPNLEYPNALLRSKRDRPEPAGFGPINPAWPGRIGKFGKEYGPS